MIGGTIIMLGGLLGNIWGYYGLKMSSWIEENKRKELNIYNQLKSQKDMKKFLRDYKFKRIDINDSLMNKYINRLRLLFSLSYLLWFLGAIIMVLHFII